MKGILNSVFHLFIVLTLTGIVFSGMNNWASAADETAAELVGEVPTRIEPLQAADLESIKEEVAQIQSLTTGFIPANRILYDNGPLVNSAGTGAGGADESILQDTTLGLNSLGFGVQFADGNRLAEDFVVADGPWKIQQINFYAYQTGSPTNPSSITGIYLQIWDGPPNDPTSTVIWGDLTTNRLFGSRWSGIFRTSETIGSGDITRPVMLVVAAVNATLENGTYWLDWTIVGSDSYSGPWAPPITINSQPTTGNALQFLASQENWQDLIDLVSLTPQGIPFVIYEYKFPWILMYPAILSGGVGQ